MDRQHDLLGPPLFWLACATAGYVYSLQRGIPSSVVLAALPAFLLEATFFLTLGVESWRKRLEKLPSASVAAVLVVAAVAPYCAACWRSDRSDGRRWRGSRCYPAWSLSGMWFCRRSPPWTCCLLVLMAAVVLAKVFPSLYIRPARPAAA